MAQNETHKGIGLQPPSSREPPATTSTIPLVQASG